MKNKAQILCGACYTEAVELWLMLLPKATKYRPKLPQINNSHEIIVKRVHYTSVCIHCNDITNQLVFFIYLIGYSHVIALACFWLIDTN